MHILLLGAGRTAHYLIHYLAKQLPENQWELTVADYDENHFLDYNGLSELLHFKQLDIRNHEARLALVEKAHLVISLLPAAFHELVAKDCLALNKHFFTASYVSDGLREMVAEVESKNLLFLQEIGLDPGLDHMSAMQMLDDIRQQGGEIKRFLSYTGGLMAPDNGENPWEYKFTWNPEYVVTAGRDGGMYLRNGNIKRIPYHRLFKEIDELVMPSQGKFDAYYNRNSLKYIDAYGLNQVDSVIRYTLRRKNFCEAWHAFVELGMTDNLFEFNFATPITHRDFTRMFIRTGSGSLEERFAKAIGKNADHPVMQKLQWLGIFNNEPLQLQSGTSAKFLQNIIEKKWTIEAHERDAIYMAHVCYYELNNELFKRKSYLAVEGDDYHRTAMAKTVGLPLAIAVSEFLKGNIIAKGVQIPCGKIFYEPILMALELEGIAFDEVLEKK